MCRIFGYFGSNPPHSDVAYRVASAQLAGGPDAQNFAHGESWLLGNNRLAIQGINPGHGTQPIQAGPDLGLVFNGEIYNHSELRVLLEGRGIVLEDLSDGAVLLPLYQEFGVDCFGMLDGMFAIAIVDTRTSPKLLLASDPMGVKSVYYHVPKGAGELMFASELPALLEFNGFEPRWNPEALDSLLLSRAAWGEETFFQGVSTLRGGHVLEFNGVEAISRPYEHAYARVRPSQDLPTVAEELRELLDFEVERMLQAEVPVCLILSGGLDSSLLCALASRKRPQLDSFHVTYGVEWADDERSFARDVANAFNLKHHEVIIQPDELPGLFEKMVAALGQPNAAPHALSSYALFESIHQAGFKVAIAGEGADEIFGGYDRFAKALEGREGWEKSYLDAFGPVPVSIRNQLYSSAFTERSSEPIRRSSLATQLLQSDAATDRLSLLLSLDQNERFQNYILRRTDTLSMAHAVEVRVPFCEPEVLAFGRALKNEAKIAAGQVKRAVYGAAEGILPSSVLQRRKQPFTLPVELFLTPGQPLFELFRDLLTSEKLKRRGVWNTEYLDELLARQAGSSSRDVASALWLAAVTEMWFRLYID